MAFHFGAASGDRIVMTDNAAFTFPDADWTVAGWVKCTDRTGTSNRRLISYMTGTSKFLIVEVGDASAAARADDIRAQFLDDDGTTITADSSSNPFGSNTSWTHVLIRRGGTTLTVLINGTEVASQTNAGFDGLDAGDWKWGNRQYDDTPWKGDMAEWAKWDRSLSDAEIAALVKGFSPEFFTNSLKFYIPMMREYVEKRLNIAVANTGTSVAEHPPMIYPSYTLVGKPSVAIQNVLPPLISGNTQLYAPTFVPGAFTIQPPAIASGETLYNPTLTLSAISITAPLLDSSAVLYAPSLSVGSVTLTPPAIDSTTQLYTPAILNASQQNLDIPFITSSETFYNPTLTVGQVTISVPIIDSITTLYDPTIAPGNVTLQPPVINSTVTFYAPTITATYSVDMPFISSHEQLYDPTIVPSTLTVPMPFISAGTTMYSPAFIFGQSLSMPVISGNTVLHAPSISFSFFFVAPSSTGFSSVDPNTNDDFSLVI